MNSDGPRLGKLMAPLLELGEQFWCDAALEETLISFLVDGTQTTYIDAVHKTVG